MRAAPSDIVQNIHPTYQTCPLHDAAVHRGCSVGRGIQARPIGLLDLYQGVFDEMDHGVQARPMRPEAHA